MTENEICEKCGKKLKSYDKFSYKGKRYCNSCSYDIEIASRKRTDKCYSCKKHVFEHGVKWLVCRNNIYCYDCYKALVKKEKEQQIKRKTETKKQTEMKHYIPPYSGGIKCPFCGQHVPPIVKTPTSTVGNIARGAVFLPWGVVSAVKNKPYVQCPHCGMKILQG